MRGDEGQMREGGRGEKGDGGRRGRGVGVEACGRGADVPRCFKEGDLVENAQPCTKKPMYRAESEKISSVEPGRTRPSSKASSVSSPTPLLHWTQ
jgi:hypothetical protein